MFSRFKKCVLCLCIALLALIALPTQQANAQDYVPAFGRIDLNQAQNAVENACVTIVPLSPEPSEVVAFQIRPYMMWAPTILAGGPQCVPDPQSLDQAIGLVSDYLLIPKKNGDETMFEAVGGTTVSQLGYTLNPNVSTKVFEEAAKGESIGYFDELVGVWYMGQEEAVISSINLIPPFGGTESFYSIRLTILNAIFKADLELTLTPATVLYQCPAHECVKKTLAELCPHVDGLTVLFAGSYPKFTKLGAITKMEHWTTIAHVYETFDLCPPVLAYNYLDSATTWAVVPAGAVEDIEFIVQQQNKNWMREIVLQPVGIGQPVLGNATFATLDAGEISLIGIAVVVGGVILKFIAAARGAPVMP